jgi:gliding motility-associated-like protein
MQYTYLGVFSGKHRYNIKLTLYRDCQVTAVNPNPTPFDPTITIGIYNNNASRTLFRDLDINAGIETSVNPPSGGSQCSFVPNVCLKECIYQRNVDLDPSSVGYHLVWLRCCRTDVITNLTTNAGQGYYAFIPPTSTPNSSPYFVGVPAPFICANDLSQVINSATDPEGDSLVYSLVHPFAGGTASNPSPNPTTTLSLPLPLVTYNTGFSASQPFGAGGTASVNPSSGLCDFKAVNAGAYAVAVEVKEYRNGNPLSSVRRDVLLMVLNCPPNPPANLAATGGSGNTTPTIIAGETTCFPITFSDQTDSIYVTSFGDILDGTGGYTGPLASLPDRAGRQTVTAQFCWTPNCNAVRTAPYIFSVQARDNGCPAKITTINYSVKVDPFRGVNTIIGDTFICSPVNGKIYSVNGRAGSTYTWTVTGGTLISGQGTPTVTVNWPASTGNGSINVVETSSKGCVGINNSRTVVLQAKPLSNSISGDNIPCEGDKSITYTVNNNSGNTFIWTVTGGTIISGGTSNQINVNWGASGSGRIVVIEYTSGGCPGDSNILNVSIRPKPILNAGQDRSICDPGAPIQLSASGAQLYQWTPGSSLSNANISNPVATPLVTTDYVVAGKFDPTGCTGYDTVRVNVYNRPASFTVSGDIQPCEFTSGVSYNVSPRNGSTYQWFVIGGNINGSSSASSIQVNWGAKGTGKVMVIETNQFGCKGDTMFLNIIIREVPKLDAGADSVICEGETIQLNASGANIFIWTPNPSLNNPNIFNPSVNPLFTTRYFVKGYLVQGGCEASDSVTVTVLNKPVLNIGAGDTICRGQTVELRVLVGTDFRWNTGSTTQSIFVTPSATSAFWVLVQNQKCIFDTLKAFVVVNPTPVAAFTASDTSGVEPLKVDFTNQTTDADTYDWRMGDGIGRFNSTNVSYLFEIPGKYIVRLTASNVYGCEDSASVEITVEEMKYFIFIPNVITPDGDDKNDLFEIQYSGYLGIKGIVINRWGQTVYQWTGDDWWNGRINGNEPADGEYFYIIECRGLRGRKDIYKGSLTIIR